MYLPLIIGDFSLMSLTKMGEHSMIRNSIVINRPAILMASSLSDSLCNAFSLEAKPVSDALLRVAVSSFFLIYFIKFCELDIQHRFYF